MEPVPLCEILGRWLAGRAWVSYSLELPRTRRFWLSALGRPFAAHLHLVVPDLRAVLKAVELGMGVSLLPDYVCTEALRHGRVVELFPVSRLTPEEPWFACARPDGTNRDAVRRFLTALQSDGVAPT